MAMNLGWDTEDLDWRETQTFLLQLMGYTGPIEYY
jgi:hypothetical protein